ncbi:MAG: hypothetical protein ACK47B_29070 [Armatimonadota bacterium]
MRGEAPPELSELCSRLQDCIGPFAGKVEYGNLRSRIDQWDSGCDQPVTNIALVYETPGGSTDQINISYYHQTRAFTLIDEHVGEVDAASVDEVMARISPRVHGIPAKRRQALYDEIRRQLDSGNSTAGVVGHLNRMMQSSLLGGSITHHELRDGMTYAVQYMKDRPAGGA